MTDAAVSPQAVTRRAPPAFVYGVWLAYSLLIGWLALYHEPWRDEVRAFSIAKAATSFSDLLRLLHNEGHTPLWYLLLEATYGLLHTTAALKISSWAIASASALVFLRCAPFSMLEKTLFLLGMCPVYEYSVLCREYGVSMLLLFLFCAGFGKRFTQPFYAYIPLAMLAFSNLFAAVIAGAIVCTMVTEPAPVRRAWTYYGWPLCVCAAMAVTAWITFPDHKTSAYSGVFSDNMVSVSAIAALVLGLVAAAGVFLLRFARVQKMLRIGLYIVSAISIFLSGNVFGSAFFSGGLVPANMWLFVFYLYFLPRTRLLFIFAGVTAVFSLCHFFVYYFSPWHQDLLYCLVIALLWIEGSYYPDPPVLAEKKTMMHDVYNFRRILFPWVFIVFLAFQIWEGAIFSMADIARPFSASADVARLIRRTPAWHDAIIIGEPDYLMEPLPYYIDNPLYFPRGKRFGQWTLFSHEFADHLSLGELLKQAHALHDSTGKPVLILLRAGMVKPGKAGSNVNGYGRLFEWGAMGSSRLLSEARFVGRFTGALTDEDYDVYELVDAR